MIDFSAQVEKTENTEDKESAIVRTSKSVALWLLKKRKMNIYRMRSAYLQENGPNMQFLQYFFGFLNKNE